jgi:nitrite reductase/ring-hydroxylating ferredoxin subunit
MRPSRRELIQCAGCTLLLIGCGVKTGDSNPISDTDPENTETDTAEIEELLFDPCETEIGEGWDEIPLSDLPELDAVGGYVQWNDVVIAHVSEGCYAAVSARCTHQSGEIFYSAIRGQFSCLEHAATFEIDGEWVMGQVTTDLQSYLIAKREASLFLNRI